MQSKLVVRSPERPDEAQWRELRAAQNAFHDRVGPTALSEEVVRTTWERFFDPSEPMHALVTVPDGRLPGRALIEAVCDRAREAGSPRVYWQTHETNARAMRLYDQVAERSGFIVYRKPL